MLIAYEKIINIVARDEGATLLVEQQVVAVLHSSSAMLHIWPSNLCVMRNHDFRCMLCDDDGKLSFPLSLLSAALRVRHHIYIYDV